VRPGVGKSYAEGKTNGPLLRRTERISIRGLREEVADMQGHRSKAEEKSGGNAKRSCLLGPKNGVRAPSGGGARAGKRKG